LKIKEESEEILTFILRIERGTYVLALLPVKNFLNDQAQPMQTNTAIALEHLT
jgi:hypothetical protein